MTLNRIQPAIPAEHMKTYEIRAPLATHFRPATCEEVMCDAFIYGWRTIVPADSAAAAYIRHDKTRSHSEGREPGGLACFTFGPGQQAFPGKDHDHRLPNGRPETFLVKDGDWRGNPRGTPPRVHTADTWTDDFANHQDKLATRLERG